MSPQLYDLTRRLAENAETVCRHYLSNGRRVGNYKELPPAVLRCCAPAAPRCRPAPPAVR
jgi:hypothetical protein